MSSLNFLSLLCLLDSFCFYNYLYLKKSITKKNIDSLVACQAFNK
jgi:hypothetical protein